MNVAERSFGVQLWAVPAAVLFFGSAASADLISGSGSMGIGGSPSGYGFIVEPMEDKRKDLPLGNSSGPEFVGHTNQPENVEDGLTIGDPHQGRRDREMPDDGFMNDGTLIDPFEVLDVPSQFDVETPLTDLYDGPDAGGDGDFIGSGWTVPTGPVQFRMDPPDDPINPIPGVPTISVLLLGAAMATGRRRRD